MMSENGHNYGHEQIRFILLFDNTELQGGCYKVSLSEKLLVLKRSSKK